MTRRNQILLIIILVLVAVLLAIGLLRLTSRAPFLPGDNTLTIPDDTVPFNNGTNINPAASLPSSVQVITKAPSTQASLLAVASTFAEKYGSFSTDSNFENLKETRVLMSNSLQLRTDGQIKKGQPATGEFYGVSTKVVKTDILNLNEQENQAQILVTTQRSETKGDAMSLFVYYQKILLRLIRNGDTWLVDDATWQ